MFGATGLVFGPVIAGVFVVVWQAVSQSSLQSYRKIGDKSIPENT